MHYDRIAQEVGPRTGATQEWIYQVLRHGIVAGELEGGTQLKQDEISASLCVSHIPVREALRQLEAQGLVTIHPNRGASVSELTRNEVLDMIEVRATLSVMKLKNSFPFLEQPDFEQMRQAIDMQRKTEDLLETERLNYRFHKILGKHNENSTADRIIDMVHDNIDRYVRKSFYEREERRERCIREHEEILAACQGGRFDDACDLLLGHILNAKDYIPVKF